MFHLNGKYIEEKKILTLFVTFDFVFLFFYLFYFFVWGWGSLNFVLVKNFSESELTQQVQTRIDYEYTNTS